MRLLKTLSTKAGISSQDAKVGGAIFDFLSDATTSVLTEQDLYSATLPAGILAVNGDKIVANFAGITANNINSKTANVYFAGVSIGSFAMTTALQQWAFQIRIIRVSAAIVRCVVVTSQKASSNATIYTEITGLTLANSQILKLTGLTPTAIGDITTKVGTIEWKPTA